jgi:hypothetical protein
VGRCPSSQIYSAVMRECTIRVFLVNNNVFMIARKD